MHLHCIIDLIAELSGLVMKNYCTHQIHTDTTPRKEVKLPCALLCPISICVAVLSCFSDLLVSIALVQDHRNGLLTAY